METAVFDDFYERHYRLFLSIAQQRLEDLGNAEDITAELFKIAWSHYRAGNALTISWAYGVLRNLIGDEYRRLARRRRFLSLAGPPFASDVVDCPIDEVLTVRQALLELSAKDRELLHMAYWEDLTGEEISNILDCSHATVRARLTRARNRLKGLLEENFKQAPAKKGE